MCKGYDVSRDCEMFLSLLVEVSPSFFTSMNLPFLKFYTSRLCLYFLMLSTNFLSLICSQSMTRSPFCILASDFFLLAYTKI
jgi:hypothetical protein